MQFPFAICRIPYYVIANTHFKNKGENDGC